MNDFIQIDEYLARKLKENCDDLNKFVLEYVYRINELSEQDIDHAYSFARLKVRKGFQKDCDIFKKTNEHFSEIVSDVCNRGFEKINTIAESKFISFIIQYKSHEGEVDKKTLLKWLSGNDL